MTNEEKVKDMFSEAVCTIDPFGIQWEVRTETYQPLCNNYRITGDRAPKILGTSPNSEEEAWEYAWQGVNEIMLKKLEQ